MAETDRGEQFSLSALKEELKDALQKPEHSRIPLFIAALAALLSIISLADTETDKIAMSAHIEASNKFAYFQAKAIRHTDSKIAAQLLAKLDAAELSDYWQKKATRYKNEKNEIFKDARKQEKIRETALTKGDYYKVGVTLLQIAIVLASASMILGGGALFAMSVILTLISLVYSINGVGLYYEIPTDPVGFIDWGTGMIRQFQQSGAG